VQRDHGPLASGMARGASALIQDLKQRGMLDDTLVLWTTEFGRMPSTQAQGRDHNPYCFTNWLCGGGIRAHRRGRERRLRLQARDARTRRKCTTSTPRSCACSASITRSSPSATTASTAGSRRAWHVIEELLG